VLVRRAAAPAARTLRGTNAVAPLRWIVWRAAAKSSIGAAAASGGAYFVGVGVGVLVSVNVVPAACTTNVENDGASVRGPV
jgi:hypothetical protein